MKLLQKYTLKKTETEKKMWEKEIKARFTQVFNDNFKWKAF